MFIIILLCLLKDVFLDYHIIKIKRPRFYWAEHGPFALFIFIIGIWDLSGFGFFEGYVGKITMILAGIDFLLDLYADLIEDSSVYGRGY